MKPMRLYLSNVFFFRRKGKCGGKTIALPSLHLSKRGNNMKPFPRLKKEMTIGINNFLYEYVQLSII